MLQRSAVDVTENYLYPNIRQSIWILVLLVVLMFVTDVPLVQHPADFALETLIAFWLILEIALRRANTSLRQICPLAPVRLSLLLPMALTVIGTNILVSEIDNLLQTFLPSPAWFNDLYENHLGGRMSLWDSILALVVIAPLTEELLMRGFILRGFLSHYSTRKAILASAVLFGLLHLNPWQFIGATILGILCAWWFIQTRSILPCLFGHALYNALPLTLEAVFRLEIQGYTGEFRGDEFQLPWWEIYGYTGEFGKVEFQPFWFDCVGLILAALGVCLLIRQFRKSSNTVPGIVIGHKSDE